jgi:hypothetical protein
VRPGSRTEVWVLLVHTHTLASWASLANQSNLQNDDRRLKKGVSATKSDPATLYPVSRRFRHIGRLSRPPAGRQLPVVSA